MQLKCVCTIEFVCRIIFGLFQMNEHTVDNIMCIFAKISTLSCLHV